MYEIIRGPLVWIAFIGFFGGMAYQFINMARLAKKDRVVYPTLSAKFGMRSVLHWLVPFGGRNMQLHPFFTVLSFAFHVCVLVTPLFLMGHAVLWQESWGIRWWSLPEAVADVMTLVVIFACVFFIIRRLVRPEVRNVSYPSDFVLALLVMAPFATGFAAHHQWLPYKPMIIIHGLSGVLWLLAIPWTRLVHMLWFPFTRAYMGSEFGSVRHSRDW
ncbi:MAG: nitrate reductase [Acidobacteriota bacterium]|nr:nitrate reductase [Acidobacteriota bacterium]